MTNEIAISTESIAVQPRPNGEATAGCSIKLGPEAAQILKFRALRRLAREIRDRTTYPAAKPTRNEITLVVTSSILPDQQQGCSVCYLLPYNFICLNPTGRYAGALGFRLPTEMRPHISAAPAASLAGKPRLKIGQADVIRPLIAATTGTVREIKRTSDSL